VDVSSTEIGYLNGVTSASIQTQLNDKAPLNAPTFTGTVTSSNNLIVDGDFTVNGTNFNASATSITIEDNMLQLAHQNAANTVDLGLVVGYNDGTAKHAGIVRDVSDSKWKLFKDVTTEPTTTVNFGQGSLDDLAVAGIEATTATIGDVSNTELQYLNGVTSSIQTQLDAKQAIISGVSDTEIGYLDGVTSSIQTQLDSKDSSEQSMTIALSDEATPITAGNSKLTMRAPFAMTLTKIPRASLKTASTSGIPTVDINENGTTILSTKLTIDANEKTSTTAATAAVLSDTSIADDAEITFDIDVSGTGAIGLKVTLYYKKV
jgi:metal-dependent HD superfamily phosphatase/phosphodiesterase